MSDDCNLFPTYPLRYQPERFRSAIYASPNASRLRWWKAYLDPTYDIERAKAATTDNKHKWLWVEQETGGKLVVVKGERAARRYFREGETFAGDIMLTFLPEELPLGDHDIVMPTGRADAGIALEPDARSRQYKDILKRGSVETEKTGTLTSSGTTITGSGTAFTTTLQVGDCIKAGGQQFLVETITSDTSLTVNTAPSPALGGNKWFLCTEQLDHPFVARMDDAYGPSSAVYRYGEDFVLDTDDRTIRWNNTSNAPLPGALYSVIYYTLPRFIIQHDLGNRVQVVNGKPLIQNVGCRLYTPSDWQE